MRLLISAIVRSMHPFPSMLRLKLIDLLVFDSEEHTVFAVPFKLQCSLRGEIGHFALSCPLSTSFLLCSGSHVEEPTQKCPSFVRFANMYNGTQLFTPFFTSTIVSCVALQRVQKVCLRTAALIDLLELLEFATCQLCWCCHASTITRASSRSLRLRATSVTSACAARSELHNLMRHVRALALVVS